MITTFHRNPSHSTIPKLPWELHEVYAELEASGDTILTSSITSHNNPSSYIDDYGNTTIDHPNPIAAYGTLPRPRIPLNNNNYHNHNSSNNNSMHHSTHNNSSSNNKLTHHSTTSTNPTSTTQHNCRFTLHHTKTGKRFISESPTSTHALCSLCFNKHPNPWHDTAHCPFKHTTHIIDKAIRERIMQHNALYGAENRHFTKSLDSPSAGTKSPPGHQSPATANCAITDTSTPDIELTLSHEPLPSPPLDDDELHEIINMEIFEVPVIPQANMGHTFPLPNINEDFALDELIFDPTQYLSYSS